MTEPPETRHELKSLRRYSWNNSLWIAAQRPDASMLMGYQAWKRAGGQVKRGAKAVKILAPRTFVENPSEDADDDVKRRHLYFRTVNVFDIADVEIDLPKLSKPVKGDSHRKQLDALVQYAETKLGCSVAFERIPGSAQGRANIATREITIDSSLSVNAQLSVLVHVVAHIGTAKTGPVDYTNYSREDAEVIVEAVAWMVCGTLGLDTSDSSVAYVAGWAEHQGLDALKKHAKLVDQLARQLEDAALGAAGRAEQAPTVEYAAAA